MIVHRPIVECIRFSRVSVLSSSAWRIRTHYIAAASQLLSSAPMTLNGSLVLLVESLIELGMNEYKAVAERANRALDGAWRSLRGGRGEGKNQNISVGGGCVY